MTETLVEFLAPLAGAGHRERCLATLYWSETAEGNEALSASDVRNRLVQSRVPGARKVNVADVLAKSGPLVHVAGTANGRVNLWALTNSGRRRVQDLLALPDERPDIETNVASLTKVAAQIGDEVIRSYVDEAILCLRVGALRAAVVFLWTGAIRQLQEETFAHHSAAAITDAIRKHDTRVKRLAKLEDFAHVGDKAALIGMRELGLLDKGEWVTLGEALDLRNRCGHPTKYRPGVKRVSGYIEDVMGIVFT